MTRYLLLAFVLLLSGCPCQDFTGLDGEITYRSCIATPDQPVQRSSEWQVNIDTSEEDLVVAWSSDDPSIVSTAGDTEDVMLRAWEVGSAEVTSVMADGTSDRVVWEIARATSGELVDTYTQFVVGALEDSTEGMYGDLPTEPVGETVSLWEGQRIELELDLANDDGPVQWAPSALTADGSIEVDDTSAVVHLTGGGVGHVFDDEGETLLEVAVDSVNTLETASIALGVWAPAREEPDVAAEDKSFAYLRAVVTDASGSVIHQPPLAWSVLRDGIVRNLGAGSPGERTDIVDWTLQEGELDNYEDARACVVVELETGSGTVSRSAWIAPDYVEVYDNGTCGNRGCACSAVQPTSAPVALAVLTLGVGLVRRRRS